MGVLATYPPTVVPQQQQNSDPNSPQNKSGLSPDLLFHHPVSLGRPRWSIRKAEMNIATETNVATQQVTRRT